MKSVTILVTFLGLFYSMHFVIGSSKLWTCSADNSFNSFYYSVIKFDCSCYNFCPEMIYNLKELVCGSVKQTYESIKLITFESCKLSSINTLPIQKFKSLKELQIISNDIKNIDRELFNNDCDLSKLSITNSSVASISKNAFKHLNSLKQLLLKENSIETIEDDTFINLTELALLSFDKNKLKSINERTFVGLKSLQNLWLENNNINFIHKNAFHDLTHLEWLDLESNFITEFHFELVSPMRHTLQELEIDKNNLTELEISKDLHFSALTVLDIAGNNFDCCKLKQFFSSNEGKPLAKCVIFAFMGVFCDGDRNVDLNGNVPNINCTENSSDSTTNTIDYSKTTSAYVTEATNNDQSDTKNSTESNTIENKCKNVQNNVEPNSFVPAFVYILIVLGFSIAILFGITTFIYYMRFKKLTIQLIDHSNSNEMDVRLIEQNNHSAHGTNPLIL